MGHSEIALTTIATCVGKPEWRALVVSPTHERSLQAFYSYSRAAATYPSTMDVRMSIQRKQIQFDNGSTITFVTAAERRDADKLRSMEIHRFHFEGLGGGAPQLRVREYVRPS